MPFVDTIKCFVGTMTNYLGQQKISYILYQQSGLLIQQIFFLRAYTYRILLVGHVLFVFFLKNCIKIEKFCLETNDVKKINIICQSNDTKYEKMLRDKIVDLRKIYKFSIDFPTIC